MPPTPRPCMGSAMHIGRDAGRKPALCPLSRTPGPERFDDGEHLAVDPAVGGDEMALLGREWRSVHAGDPSARLLDDERAGGDVPRLQVLLPEPFESAGRFEGF